MIKKSIIIRFFVVFGLLYVNFVFSQANTKNNHIEWSYIGPSYISGRITDIESYIDSPHIIFAGAASSGIFKSTDQGQTWNYIFKNDGYNSIGDIALSQSNKGLIWVGTGEPNCARSSFYGDGVYKSNNGGKTWENMGLRETHYISKIIIHPQNPDIIYVGACGPLYTKSPNRGLFKSVDGGKTWKKILYINSGTAIIDLVIHPKDPKILYAATWERIKKPWKFESYGKSSGVYKTIDEGNSFKRVYEGDEFTGRIGITISKTNPDILYILVDNHREKRAIKNPNELTINQLCAMSIDEFLGIKNKYLQNLLNRMKGAKVYTPAVLKSFVRQKKITPKQIALMLFDINDRQFNPFITGPELFKTRDGGKSWEQINKESLHHYFYTFGFFFGKVYVSPDNTEEVYVLGIELLKSKDGGKSFECISKSRDKYNRRFVHIDSHALWINTNKPDELYLGTDGGVNYSINRGKNWRRTTSLPIAQCYRINTGEGQNYPIYTGLQDNGVLVGIPNYPKDSQTYVWQRILNKDGGFTCEDLISKWIIYSTNQFGGIFRLDVRTRRKTSIKPSAPKLSSPYRFNWLTPFFISRFNPNELFLGANIVLKSLDQGKTWSEISPDLSKGQQINNRLPYGTITALCESPIMKDLIFAGTDDGNLWYSDQGGNTWKQIGQILPKKEITSITPSRFDKNKIYITMSGLFEDDFNTYIFMTENLGLDWMTIGGNIKDQPIFVLREHPKEPGMLLCGTVNDIFFSKDDGMSFTSIRGNLPAVPIYDICIVLSTNEIILGTHGRGIYLSKPDFIISDLK